MVKDSKPRAGSLAFWPRKRAKRIYPSVSSYPQEEKPKLLDFAGYKAGMTQVVLLNNQKNSPSFGQYISVPVTILDIPAMKVFAIRSYQNTLDGLKVFSEAWSKELPKDLSRKIRIKNVKEDKIGGIEKNLEKISKIRLSVATQPRLSGIGKKTPEVFEIEVGGKDIKEKFEFAKQFLGKEIKFSDIFKEGELVDVISVSKGKGTQGPVKRFGIKVQSRHAKKKRRHVGSLGQERPGKTRHTVAQGGQMGFQSRTEFNKRILKIGQGKDVNPKGGLKRYGIIKGDFVLLEGSVPGATKRLIRLRSPIRPLKSRMIVPEVKEITKA